MASPLQDTIRDYKRQYADARRQERTRFQALSFQQALRDAALAREPGWRPNTSKRSSHQRRIAADTLAVGLAKLRKSTGPRWRPTTFDEIHRTCRGVSTSTLGLGELWAYDTAMRLGFFWGCEPNIVHMHAGTRAGAEAFLGRKVREPWLPRTAFGSLAQWPAVEIENYLCIMKDRLPAGGRRRPTNRARSSC